MASPEPTSPSHLLSPRIIQQRSLFLEFLYLGLTAFGGPSAHVSLFHTRFVSELKWLSSRLFTEAFALGQGLPGPGSTQLMFIIAMHHAGVWGAIKGFIGWLLPGFLAMALLSILEILLLPQGTAIPPKIQRWQHSLSAIAIGLVALAGYTLAVKLMKDKSRVHTFLVLLGCIGGIWTFDIAYMTPVLIIIGGTVSISEEPVKKLMSQVKSRYWTRRSEGHVPLNDDNEALVVNVDGNSTEQQPPGEVISDDNEESMNMPTKRDSTYALILFTILLIVSFSVWHATPSEITSLNGISWSAPFQIFSALYICGGIIFGGGPVVIPLIYNYVVSPGWLSQSEFMLGLTMMNVLPGPNFNFASYAGGVALVRLWNVSSTGGVVGTSLLGSFLGYCGIFMPGLLVKVGLWPFWTQMRQTRVVKGFLDGVCSVSVGMVFCSCWVLFKGLLEVKDLWLDIYVSIMITTAGVCGYMGIPAVVVVTVVSFIVLVV